MLGASRSQPHNLDGLLAHLTPGADSLMGGRSDADDYQEVRSSRLVTKSSLTSQTRSVRDSRELNVGNSGSFDQSFD